MRSLSDIRMVELLPPNLTADPFVAALGKAFDAEFHLLVADTEKLLIFYRLSDQPDNVLDHLAWQFNVDSYDQSLPRATKVALVASALYWHSVKGTPHAVEHVVSAYLGDGTVEEWFDYGGAPYHFKVTTTGGKFPTMDRATLFLRAVRVVKRFTQILETLIIQQSAEHPLYFGGAMQIGQTVTIGST